MEIKRCKWDISNIKLQPAKEVVLNVHEATQLLNLYFTEDAYDLTDNVRVDRIEYLNSKEYHNLELDNLELNVIKYEQLRFRVPADIYEEFKTRLNIDEQIVK